MIPAIVGLTARQFLRQRRVVLLLVLAVLPVLLGVTYALTAEASQENADFAAGLLAHFVVALVLPLTALVVGTAVLGQELEDGTVVYLIAKPLARWQVVVAKVGTAWLVTAAIVVFSAVVSGLIAIGGDAGERLVPAFVVAIALAALAYSALFVMLSIRFSRALVIGLVYVFVWEATLSQFISGVRFFSVRAYAIGIADAISTSTSRLVATPLGATPAVVLLLAVTVLATLYAVRRLDRYQMSERV